MTDRERLYILIIQYGLAAERTAFNNCYTDILNFILPQRW